MVAIQHPVASQAEADAGTLQAIRQWTPKLIGRAIANHPSTIQHNLNAAVDPTVNDDATLGYEPLSIWLNQVTDEAFKCFEATAGAALWVNTTLTVDELATVAITGDAADLVTSSNSSLTPEGYVTLPSGLMVQWGQLTVGADASAIANLSATFPTAALNASCQVISNSTTLDGIICVTSVTTTTITLTNGNGVILDAYWQAYGH